jgi:cob(I)alamin adenosyltransferase
MTKQSRKGLLIVYTGDGKGKSTAAFGMVLRAWGRGMRVCVIQFIKSEKGKWGEIKAAEKLGLEWITTGDGFTWDSKDLDATADRVCLGWEIAREKIASNQYDLIVLDEMTYAFQFGWLEINNVLEWLAENKPPDLHLVITGRGAPEQLIEKADLVTEMKMIKHPFDKGILAQPGTEY